MAHHEVAHVIVAGVAVEVSPQALHFVEETLLVHLLRTGEDEMLEEVRVPQVGGLFESIACLHEHQRGYQGCSVGGKESDVDAVGKTVVSCHVRAEHKRGAMAMAAASFDRIFIIKVYYNIR